MRKFFLLILILLGLGFYFLYAPSSTKVTQTPAGNGVGSTAPDPSFATFTFDNEKVKLSNGMNSAKDDAGLVMETKILEQGGYGDLNHDDKEDAVVFLSQSGGGSGVFIYAAAYVSGPITYKGTNAVYLGDRVAPQSVSVSNGVVTVKYLDRRPDEPFAADPTVPSTKILAFKDGQLVEK